MPFQHRVMGPRISWLHFSLVKAWNRISIQTLLVQDVWVSWYISFYWYTMKSKREVKQLCVYWAWKNFLSWGNFFSTFCILVYPSIHITTTTKNYDFKFSGCMKQLLGLNSVLMCISHILQELDVDSILYYDTLVMSRDAVNKIAEQIMYTPINHGCSTTYWWCPVML